MKKYKLIKEYPGSFPLNTEIEFYENWGMYGVRQNCTLQKEIVENNPEFWQKIEINPILITEDNFYFYKDSKDIPVYLLLTTGSWERKVMSCMKIIKGAYTPSRQWKVFSSKEALENYERLNRPKYSLEDIAKCYTSPKESPLYIGLMDNLKELGK